MGNEWISGFTSGAIGGTVFLFVRYYVVPNEKKGVSAWRNVGWAVVVGVISGAVFGLVGALLIKLTN